MSEALSQAPSEIDADLENSTADAAPQINETEDRARRMGWVPREEFRGDPDRWRPADEFLDRGEKVLPILQQNYRALEDRYTGLQTEMREARQALSDLTDRARRSDERAYQRAMRDLEARRQAAVASGDATAFAAADQEIQSLRESAPAPRKDEPRASKEEPTVPPKGPAPEVAAFVQANPWFTTNIEARQDAIAIQSSVDRQHPGLSLAERLEITRKKVRQLHPALFENTRRAAPAAVSSPSGDGARKPNPRGFEALPADVRKE